MSFPKPGGNVLVPGAAWTAGLPLSGRGSRLELLDGHTARGLNQLGRDIKEHLQLLLGQQGEAGYRPSISGLATFFPLRPCPQSVSSLSKDSWVIKLSLHLNCVSPTGSS